MERTTSGHPHQLETAPAVRRGPIGHMCRAPGEVSLSEVVCNHRRSTSIVYQSQCTFGTAPNTVTVSTPICSSKSPRVGGIRVENPRPFGHPQLDASVMSASRTEGVSPEFRRQHVRSGHSAALHQTLTAHQVNAECNHDGIQPYGFRTG